MITWEKQTNNFGTFVEFKIMHGDADLFTTEQILVSDEKELEECIVFANNLKKGYKDNYWIHYDDEDENISLKKMSEIIQKETSLDISKIKNWLEKLMKEDVSGARDTYAEIVAYRLIKVNEDGVFHGLINGNKSVNIGEIHKSYLKDWK